MIAVVAMGIVGMTVGVANAATLISHFSFDTDFTDQEGSNDGTAVNGAARTAVAILGGGALTLDGTDDYVDFGDITLSGAFSVSVWIKPDVLGILGDSSNRDWIRVETTSSANAVAKIGNTTTTLNAFPLFTDGEWQHVVVTRDGTGNLTFYRDKVAVASGGPNANTFTPEYIGRKSSNYYDGVMDEVRIYSGVLTTSEIEALFSGPAAATPGTLIYGK